MSHRVSILRKVSGFLFVAGLFAVVPGGLHAQSICDQNSNNIVSNCGFETGNFTDWVANPSSSFDWTVMSSFVGIDANSGTYYATTGCVGDQCISPDSSSSGAWLYQDLNTVAGDTYDLTFYYNSNNGGPTELQVLWGASASTLTASPNGTCDTVNTNCIYDDTSTTAGWNEITVDNLVATSSSTRLEFLGQQNPTWDGLDDVTVDGVSGTPEPASMLLLGAGLTVFGALRFKRRN